MPLHFEVVGEVKLAVEMPMHQHSRVVAVHAGSFLIWSLPMCS